MTYMFYLLVVLAISSQRRSMMFEFNEGYTYDMPPHFGGVQGDGMADLQYDDCHRPSADQLPDR